MEMFRNLYKQPHGAKKPQEARRAELLREQKERRRQLQDEHRAPVSGDGLGDGAVAGDGAGDGGVAAGVSSGAKRAKTLNELHGPDVGLQLSEWMRERPHDLSEWLLVACPRGQRCLVVASGECTVMYSKRGRSCFTFRSILPGGGQRRKTALTILDCIYVQAEDAFYVLDCLTYANQTFRDCDAQCRFFWLQSRFEEHALDAAHAGSKRFHLLPHYQLDDPQVTAVVLQRYPHWPDDRPPLDGFMFYHKDASYVCGSTPLVCWLFPFMVPDVLGMPVSGFYERPPNYLDPQTYMSEFDDAQSSRKPGNRTRKSAGRSLATAPTSGDMSSLDECSNESSLQELIDAQRSLEMEVTEAMQH